MISKHNLVCPQVRETNLMSLNFGDLINTCTVKPQAALSIRKGCFKGRHLIWKNSTFFPAYYTRRKRTRVKHVYVCSYVCACVQMNAHTHVYDREDLAISSHCQFWTPILTVTIV